MLYCVDHGLPMHKLTFGRSHSASRGAVCAAEQESELFIKAAGAPKGVGRGMAQRMEVDEAIDLNSDPREDFV
jgi:hypothetical protein